MRATLVRGVSLARCHASEVADWEYHLHLLDAGAGGYRVVFQHGRRGGSLRYGTKTPAPVSRHVAETIFSKTLNETVSKGYKRLNLDGVRAACDALSEHDSDAAGARVYIDIGKRFRPIGHYLSTAGPATQDLALYLDAWQARAAMRQQLGGPGDASVAAGVVTGCRKAAELLVCHGLHAFGVFIGHEHKGRICRGAPLSPARLPEAEIVAL